MNVGKKKKLKISPYTTHLQFSLGFVVFCEDIIAKRQETPIITK